MPRQHLKGIPLKRARSDVTKSMAEKEEKRVQQIEVTVK